MRLRRWVSVVALMVLAFGMGRASAGVAQALLPDGVFVRDSAGNVWLIVSGQRAKVPFRPATDDAINSVADSGLWVVPGEGGALTLGSQPDYVNAAPITVSGGSSGTQASADPPPTFLRFDVDDDRARVGQSVKLTIIAQDNKGIDWVEWEGTIIEDDENDNKPTGDSELDQVHRQGCDGATVCSHEWNFTVNTPGRFTLRARARDDAGNRSEWQTIDFRVTGNAPTATPTATKTP
jgi:hypothetical protein